MLGSADIRRKSENSKPGATVHPTSEASATLARELVVPVGLQVVGRHGDERTALLVAAVLEDAAIAGGQWVRPAWARATRS